MSGKHDPTLTVALDDIGCLDRAGERQGLTDGNRQLNSLQVPAFPVGLLPRIWRQGRRVGGSCAVGVVVAATAEDLADDSARSRFFPARGARCHHAGGLGGVCAPGLPYDGSTARSRGRGTGTIDGFIHALDGKAQPGTPVSIEDMGKIAAASWAGADGVSPAFRLIRWGHLAGVHEIINRGDRGAVHRVGTPSSSSRAGL